MYHAQPQTGAYATLEPALLSPKAAEGRVFGKVTRRLVATHTDGDTPHAQKVEALHDNRRLWIAVAAAVASDDNDMPEALRAGLVNLAGFVDRETSKLLRGEGDVRLLVEVNRRVLAGLSVEG